MPAISPLTLDMAANFAGRPHALAVLMLLPFILAFGNSSDLFLLLSFAMIRNREAFAEFLHLYINPIVVIDFVKAGAALYALFLIARFFIGLKEPSSPSGAFPAKPMMFRCRTSHTRLFPKKHNFSYSYLWVGVPVGWKGSVGGLLSSDDPRETDSSPWYMRLCFLRRGGTWFTVNGDEYLGRGHVDGGLEEKLQNFLQSQVCTVNLQSIISRMRNARCLWEIEIPTSWETQCAEVHRIFLSPFFLNIY